MDFIKFLTKNNAYRQFMHNLAYVSDHKWGWDDYKEWNAPEEYIANAFCWAYSNEGHDFWQNLHDKWTREI